MVTPLAQAAPSLAGPSALTKNRVALALDEVPRLEPDAFRGHCLGAMDSGARLSALFVATVEEEPELFAVLTDDTVGQLAVMRGRIQSGGYTALSAEAPQAQAFEREIFELHGIRPEGHPWLKPLRRHLALEKGSPSPPPAHPFFRVEGPGIHEVAVGPVHAGVIEPGHFRFQCCGEEVVTLEIHLGYQHRGAEALLLGASPARRLVIAETLAGDTSVGHATAYAMALEALAELEVPARGHFVRAIGLELERLANHAGDMGALAGDVGYLPAASYFGRLRGEFLNLSLELCGNRFGRSLVQVGGVRFDLEPRQIEGFLGRLSKAAEHVDETAAMMFDTPSVLSRFERTGVVSREVADRLGLVGPAARAAGCPRDVRKDHPVGAWSEVSAETATFETGDVLARGRVRWLECQSSVEAIKRLVHGLPAGPVSVRAEKLQPRRIAVALTEGWRGEVAHVALTNAEGGLAAYKIIDPSFHNWFGLAFAMRGNQISDFPLCNKSFNLSYCGHDL
ncbi:MAG TPA: hydrogenase [Myxococcales bacterium]|nr:hydrogenase [Myxococcales bacterium]